MRNKVFATLVLSVAVNISVADTAPTELLRDATFSLGFTFGMPDDAKMYRVTGKEISNQGLSKTMDSADGSDPFKRLSQADDGHFIAGSNRLGRSTDAPVWSMQGYHGSTTPYSRANDYVNGQPVGGDAGCPDLVSVPSGCVWRGFSSPVSGSKELISIVSGRGADGRDADLKYRINEKDSYTTWDVDKYWGNCTIVGSGGTAYDQDNVCSVNGNAITFTGTGEAKTNFQTEVSSGLPMYFVGADGGRWQTELPINQYLVGDTNLKNISKLVFSGSVRLKRLGRANYTTPGVHICSDEEMFDGRWDGSYNRYSNCYVRLRLDKDGFSSVAGGSGAEYRPRDMAVFDMGIGLVDIKTGRGVWLGVINSLDWMPDVIRTDSGTYMTSGCSAQANANLYLPSDWICDLAFDPASSFYAKLPSFVFYNSTQQTPAYPPLVQINSATKEILDGSSPDNMISTWNTNNVHDSGWVSFRTEYELNGSQVDLMQWIQVLLDTAHAKDTSISNSLGDYRLHRLGISLEQGGPIDTEVALKGLSLKATYKANSTLTNMTSAINSFVQ